VALRISASRAPLFALFDHRVVTLKELAEACHLSPATLYHFPVQLEPEAVVGSATRSMPSSRPF